MNLMIFSCLAVLTGCWECIGLTDAEITSKYGVQVLAYEDDYDNTVGDVPIFDNGPSQDYGGPGAGCWGPAGVLNT